MGTLVLLVPLGIYGWLWSKGVVKAEKGNTPARSFRRWKPDGWDL